MIWSSKIFGRTRSAESFSFSDLFRADDFLPLLTELLDAKRHYVARFEKHRRGLHAKADAGRRAGDDNVAGLHHEELRAIPNQVLAAEAHGLGVAPLPLLAVDVEPHVQILRILDFVLGDEPWPNRSKGLAAFALVPLATASLDLKDAFGYIVAEEIACDGVSCLVLCEITSPLSDHDAKLDLPVELAGLARDDGVVVRPANARRRLVEDDRLFRDRHAGCGSVVGIVQPDRNEVAHVADAGPKPWFAGNGLHPFEVCFLDFGKAARGKHRAVDVLHDA